MIRFVEPLWLLSGLFIPLGWGLVGWASRRRRARFGRLADEGFAATLGAGPQLDRARRREALLLFLGLGLIGASLSRPQLGYTTETQKSEGSDLVVALDLSRSMLAEDLAPSRLERAKIEIRALLASLAGDRVGLVGFTTVAQPLSPLTTDGRHVSLQLERIQPESLPSGGTSIGAGIEGALALLSRTDDGEDRAERAIVVFTDGEDHEGEGQGEARRALEQGVRVHLVGLGGDEGEPIPLLRDGRRAGYVKDAMGRTVLTRLEPAGIRAVAEAGGGVAVVQEPGRGLVMAPLRRAVDAMRTVERSESRTRRTYVERYRWLLLPGLVALVASAWARVGLALSMGLVLAPPAVARAQALEGSPAEEGPPPLLRRWVPELESARRSLEGGEADAALRSYDAAAERLGRRPEILLGRGLARLKAEAAAEPGAAASPSNEEPAPPSPEALQDLQSAADSTKDPGLRARALTALANAHRRSGDLDAAVQMYKDALRTDPEAEDARRNLALTQALQRIQDEPPPSSGDGEQKQDEQNSEQDEGQDDASSDPEKDGKGQEGAEDEPEQSPDEPSEANEEQGDSEGEPNDSAEPEPKEDAGEAEGREAGATEAKDETEEAPENARARILRSLEQKEQELQRKRLLKRLQAPRVNKPW